MLEKKNVKEKSKKTYRELCQVSDEWEIIGNKISTRCISHSSMDIKFIISNKKQFLDLLMLADEQESMIDKYLERGDMFALYDDGLKAVSVVTCEGENIFEIKNIAVYPSFQRKGYGKRLVDYIFEYYQGRCSVMFVGTGDTPSTLSFYEHCGFRISHRLKNFFIDNYDQPIYEDGKQLTDMVYLRKDFSLNRNW